MQAELKINRGGDKNDLMVIERAGSTTATSNSERGEHKSTLLIFFFSTAHFFSIFTATSQVRLTWKDSVQQRPARRC